MCATGCCLCCESCWDVAVPRRRENEDEPDSAPSKRGCTDVWCLMLFIVTWVIMIFVAVMCYSLGNVDRLIYGYDSYGNICGRNNSDLPEKYRFTSFSGMDMTDRKYVFFFDLLNITDSLAICVSACPDTNITTRQQLMNYSLTSGSHLCTYDLPPETYPDLENTKHGDCPVLPVPPSTPVIQRCLPTSFINVGSFVVENLYGFLNSAQILHRVMSDLYASWHYVLAFCVLALVLSIIMCFLMYLIASVVVWVLMSLAAIGSIAFTALLWWDYLSIKGYLDLKLPVQILDRESDNEYAMCVYAVIATVFTVILLLILLVLCKRVKFVVMLFKKSGDVLANMTWIFLQPFWTALVLIIFLAFWSSVLFYMASSALPTRDPVTNYTYYTDIPYLSYSTYFMVVTLIWNMEFIIACQQMTIAGAVAAYFFTSKGPSGSRSVVCPIGGSICRLISHHLGTVAFGSAIITLVRIPRLVLVYMTRKVREYKEAQQCIPCISVFEKCCYCCLKCVESCLKYINQNAYTITAINGSSFCRAAKTAFSTLVSNALRVAALNSVGDFVLFLGKVMVVVVTGIIALPVFMSNDSLNFHAIPIFLVCFFSYFIASCFISVYEVILDTLLLCYCLAEAGDDRDGNGDGNRVLNDNKDVKDVLVTADRRYKDEYEESGGCCGRKKKRRRRAEEEGEEMRVMG